MDPTVQLRYRVFVLSRAGAISRTRTVSLSNNLSTALNEVHPNCGAFFTTARQLWLDVDHRARR
jgi:hypothetical protein